MSGTKLLRLSSKSESVLGLRLFFGGDDVEHFVYLHGLQDIEDWAGSRNEEEVSGTYIVKFEMGANRLLRISR